MSLYQEEYDPAMLAEYSGLSLDALLQKITSDQKLRYRFNLLWKESEEVKLSEAVNAPVIPYWKYEPWFGYFMDKDYPWIYHTRLGWLYGKGTSQNNIWFFSEKLGWFWTSKQTFNDPTIGDDNQRFIFLVRKMPNGGWEGSWAILDLGVEGDPGSAEIILEYGYVPLP